MADGSSNYDYLFKVSPIMPRDLTRARVCVVADLLRSSLSVTRVLVNRAYHIPQYREHAFRMIPLTLTSSSSNSNRKSARLALVSGTRAVDAISTLSFHKE